MIRPATVEDVRAAQGNTDPIPFERIDDRALDGRTAWWLAQELDNMADAIGPVPDLAEESIRGVARELERGTWRPFIDRVAEHMQ